MKTNLFENQLTGEIQDLTRQVWLAGLGAFSRAQEEGSKIFESLVQEGQVIDEQMKKAASDTSEQVKNGIGAVRGKVEEMYDKASDSWSKLEDVFQARVARALSRLGVPTHDDLQQLLAQVEALTQSIQELSQTSGEPEAKPRKTRAHKTAETDHTDPSTTP